MGFSSWDREPSPVPYYVSVRFGQADDAAHAVVGVGRRALRAGDAEEIPRRVVAVCNALPAACDAAYSPADIISISGFAAFRKPFRQQIAVEIVFIVRHVPLGIGEGKEIAAAVVGRGGCAAVCVHGGDEVAATIVGGRRLAAVGVDRLHELAEGIVRKAGEIQLRVGLGDEIAQCVIFVSKARAVGKGDRGQIVFIVIGKACSAALRVRHGDKAVLFVVGVERLVAVCVRALYKVCAVVLVGGHVPHGVGDAQHLSELVVGVRDLAAVRIRLPGEAVVLVIHIARHAAELVRELRQVVVFIVNEAVAAAVRRGLLRLVARRVVLVARRVPQRVRDDRVIVKVCERIIIHGAGSDLLLAPW